MSGLKHNARAKPVPAYMCAAWSGCRQLGGECMQNDFELRVKTIGATDIYRVHGTYEEAQALLREYVDAWRAYYGCSEDEIEAYIY